MSINISEIFYSIQGEGPQIGTPAIFIRLAGCNLTCEWCDSKYTWKKDLITSTDISFKDLSDVICSYLINNPHPPRLLIFTGGEPLLQWSSIRQFLQYLMDSVGKNNLSVLDYNLKHLNISFETNGTIYPKLIQNIGAEKKYISYFSDWSIIISPKLQFSNQYKEHWWEGISPVYNYLLYLKFVISDKNDLKIIEKDFLHRRKNSWDGVRNEKIYLMPEATTTEQQIEKLPMLIDFARKYGCKVTLRLQVMAYGNIRGV